MRKDTNIPDDVNDTTGEKDLVKHSGNQLSVDLKNEIANAMSRLKKAPIAKEKLEKNPSLAKLHSRQNSTPESKPGSSAPSTPPRKTGNDEDSTKAMQQMKMASESLQKSQKAAIPSSAQSTPSSSTGNNEGRQTLDKTSERSASNSQSRSGSIAASSIPSSPSSASSHDDTEASNEDSVSGQDSDKNEPSNSNSSSTQSTSGSSASSTPEGSSKSATTPPPLSTTVKAANQFGAAGVARDELSLAVEKGLPLTGVDNGVARTLEFSEHSKSKSPVSGHGHAHTSNSNIGGGGGGSKEDHQPSTASATHAHTAKTASGASGFQKVSNQFTEALTQSETSLKELVTKELLARMKEKLDTQPHDDKKLHREQIREVLDALNEETQHAGLIFTYRKKSSETGMPDPKTAVIIIDQLSEVSNEATGLSYIIDPEQKLIFSANSNSTNYADHSGYVLPEQLMNLSTNDQLILIYKIAQKYNHELKVRKSLINTLNQVNSETDEKFRALATPSQYAYEDSKKDNLFEVVQSIDTSGLSTYEVRNTTFTAIEEDEKIKAQITQLRTKLDNFLSESTEKIMSAKDAFRLIGTANDYGLISDENRDAVANKFNTLYQNTGFFVELGTDDTITKCELFTKEKSEENIVDFLSEYLENNDNLTKLKPQILSYQQKFNVDDTAFNETFSAYGLAFDNDKVISYVQLFRSLDPQSHSSTSNNETINDLKKFFQRSQIYFNNHEKRFVDLTPPEKLETIYTDEFKPFPVAKAQHQDHINTLRELLRATIYQPSNEATTQLNEKINELNGLHFDGTGNDKFVLENSLITVRDGVDIIVLKPVDEATLQSLIKAPLIDMKNTIEAAPGKSQQKKGARKSAVQKALDAMNGALENAHLNIKFSYKAKDKKVDNTLRIFSISTAENGLENDLRLTSRAACLMRDNTVKIGNASDFSYQDFIQPFELVGKHFEEKLELLISTFNHYQRKHSLKNTTLEAKLISEINSTLSGAEQITGSKLSPGMLTVTNATGRYKLNLQSGAIAFESVDSLAQAAVLRTALTNLTNVSFGLSTQKNPKEKFLQDYEAISSASSLLSRTGSNEEKAKLTNKLEVAKRSLVMNFGFDIDLITVSPDKSVTLNIGTGSPRDQLAQAAFTALSNKSSDLTTSLASLKQYDEKISTFSQKLGGLKLTIDPYDQQIQSLLQQALNEDLNDSNNNGHNKLSRSLFAASLINPPISGKKSYRLYNESSPMSEIKVYRDMNHVKSIYPTVDLAVAPVANISEISTPKVNQIDSVLSYFDEAFASRPAQLDATAIPSALSTWSNLNDTQKEDELQNYATNLGLTAENPDPVFDLFLNSTYTLIAHGADSGFDNSINTFIQHYGLPKFSTSANKQDKINFLGELCNYLQNLAKRPTLKAVFAHKLNALQMQRAIFQYQSTHPVSIAVRAVESAIEQNPGLTTSIHESALTQARNLYQDTPPHSGEQFAGFLDSQIQKANSESEKAWAIARKDNLVKNTFASFMSTLPLLTAKNAKVTLASLNRYISAWQERYDSLSEAKHPDGVKILQQKLECIVTLSEKSKRNHNENATLERNIRAVKNTSPNMDSLDTINKLNETRQHAMNASAEIDFLSRIKETTEISSNQSTSPRIRALYELKNTRVATCPSNRSSVSGAGGLLSGSHSSLVGGPAHAHGVGGDNQPVNDQQAPAPSAP